MSAPLFSININNNSGVTLTQPDTLSVETGGIRVKPTEAFTVAKLIAPRDDYHVHFYVLRESTHSDDVITGYVCTFEKTVGLVTSMSFYALDLNYQFAPAPANGAYLFETSDEDSTTAWSAHKGTKTVNMLTNIYHFGHNLLDFLNQKEEDGVSFEFTSFKNTVHSSELNNIMKIITCEKYLSLVGSSYEYKQTALNNLVDNDELSLYNVVNIENLWGLADGPRESNNALASFFSNLAVLIIKAWVYKGIPKMDSTSTEATYTGFVEREIQVVLSNSFKVDTVDIADLDDMIVIQV